MRRGTRRATAYPGTAGGSTLLSLSTRSAPKVGRNRLPDSYTGENDRLEGNPSMSSGCRRGRGRTGRRPRRSSGDPGSLGRSRVPCMKKQDSHIAPVVNHLKRRISITHPFHPLFQQEFGLLEYRRSWGHDCVDCLDTEGKVVTIPLAWTDASGVQDPFVVAAAGRSYFRVEDLLRLVELVVDLQSSCCVAVEDRLRPDQMGVSLPLRFPSRSSQ